MYNTRTRKYSLNSQKNFVFHQIIPQTLSISKILPLNPAKQKPVTIANAKGQDSIKKTRSSDLPNASVQLNKKKKRRRRKEAEKKQRRIIHEHRS